MKKLILILIAILCFGITLQAQIHSFAAEVEKVPDADTFTFKHSDGNLDKVRLLGIDAPETAHNSKEISQPFGDSCRLQLQTLIGGKTVTIESAARDGYGRNLARVIADGTDVNLAMLKVGCAWLFYPKGIRADLRGEYERAFVEAKANQIGLFASETAIMPEVWRKTKHPKSAAKFLQSPAKGYKTKKRAAAAC